MIAMKLKVSKAQSIARAVFIFLFTLTSLFLAYRSFRYFYDYQSIVEKVKKEAFESVEKAVIEMNDNFLELIPPTLDIAQKLSSGEVTRETVVEYLKDTMRRNPELYGLSAAYAPYKFSPSERLYAPYIVNKEDGTLDESRLDDLYDYTLDEYYWYQETIRIGEPTWLNPYYGPASQQMLAEYADVFYDPADERRDQPAGVVIVNYSLERVQKLLNSIDIGQTSYGFIFGRNGVFASHPVREFLRTQKTIYDFAHEQEAPILAELAQRALANPERGFAEYRDPLSGQKTWVIYKQIPTNGWPLFMVFVESELLAPYNDILRSNIILLITALIVFIVIGLLLALNVLQGEEKKLWIWSGLSTLTIIAGIISLWYVQLYKTIPEGERDLARILNKSALENYLNIKGFDQTNSTFIPTGIVIDYFDVDKISEVSIGGGLWQKYISTSDLKHSVVIPNAESLITRDRLHKPLNSRDSVIAWNFFAKTRQYFSYHNYPFDYKHVIIPLSSGNIDESIILVPDLDSYRIMSPITLPGIKVKKGDSGGWNMRATYFSYCQNTLLQSVGLALNDKQQNIPQLMFNVILQRSFVNATVSYIVPLLLALLFLFFLLRSASLAEVENPPKVSSVLSPIALNISLFFAVIVAHVSLRGKFGEQPLFYLEYLYITAYAIMLFVLATLFTLLNNRNFWFVRYRQALIPQIIYFPVLTTLFYVITFFYFY